MQVTRGLQNVKYIRQSQSDIEQGNINICKPLCFINIPVEQYFTKMKISFQNLILNSCKKLNIRKVVLFNKFAYVFHNYVSHITLQYLR